MFVYNIGGPALGMHFVATVHLQRLKGVAAGVSVPVITQSSFSVGLTSTFFALGDTVLFTPVNFLFLLETYYVVYYHREEGQVHGII